MGRGHSEYGHLVDPHCGVHPIFFGLRRRGKLKPDRRSSRLRMPPRKLALAWLRQLVAIRVAAARLNGMGCPD